ncbi:hypothetical protein D499_0L00730 [Hanseniaspora uvarum DSM 2768]|nr:hypothetical protein D499_0L00730 [Hanseniaspora uvarum DSM 2768]
MFFSKQRVQYSCVYQTPQPIIINSCIMSITNEDNLPWIEKYRPNTLDEVYGQDSITSTLRNFIRNSSEDNNSISLPHMLFYGPPGTGKTSMVIALAKEIYGADNYRKNIIELNASDDRGIDVVRNQIKDFASTRQISFGSSNKKNLKMFKLVILDEADAMTNIAQNALRRIIEKYTKNVRFVILANYSYKIIPALMSRCTRFRFQPLPLESSHIRMKNIISMESIQVEDSAVLAILKISKGDMRKSLNILQACNTTLSVEDKSSIDEAMVYECVGLPNKEDINDCFASILNDSIQTSYFTLSSLQKDKGLALIDIINGFVEILVEYDIEVSKKQKLLIKLAELEYGISKGGNNDIQTSSMIGLLKSCLVD